MKKRSIYLGRATIISTLASGSSLALTGGDPVDQLAGCQITDVVFQVRTALATTGSPTLHLATNNNVALTNETADLAGDNAIERDIYGPKNKTLDSDDVAGAFKVTCGGTSSSYDAGVFDVYVEVYQPRLS